MPEYLAERYEPGETAQQADAATLRLAAVAREMRAGGLPVELIESTFVPGDEASLTRFASESAELVAEVHRRAEIPVERIVEVIQLDAGPAGRDEDAAA